MPRAFSRRLPALGLLLGLLPALGLVLAPPAHARGGAGAIEQHLLEKGQAALRKAEQAHFAKDHANARRFGLQAETLFSDVLQQAPGHRPAVLMAAQAAVFAGELARAQAWVERYRRATPAGEGDPDLHYLRAFVHLLGEKRPARALRSLQRMYSLSPRTRPVARDTLWCLALSDLGRRYLEAGNTEEAARQFATGARVARRLGDRRKEILMLADLGTTYMRAKRFIEAGEIYEGLGTLQPDYPLWHWRMGMALANQNRFADAVRAYRRVLALQAEGIGVASAHEEEIAELEMRLGNCLRHLGSGEPDAARRATLLAEAREHMQAYVERQPRDPRGHKWLGVLLQDALEKPYEALPHLERSFAIDPMCEDVLRRMIQIHARHPAPPGSDAELWKRKRRAMETDLEEGRERREAEMERRKKEDGDTGCS